MLFWNSVGSWELFFATVKQPNLQITISLIDDLPSSLSDLLPDVAPVVIAKGDQMKRTLTSLYF